MRKLAAAWFLLMLGAATALACSWDIDTIARELTGLPEVSDALFGRLEINPPLYYQMRLERVSKEIQSKPDELGLYDDAGVACDKLGKLDQAIEWMQKKKVRLDASKQPADIIKDHRYRYHANLGTFYAHKWVKQENKADTTLLKKGIAELDEAVRINPDAHFGREIVQIKVLRLLEEKYGQGLIFDGPEFEADWMFFVSEVGHDKVQKGIIGIMLMGSGAESPDMIYLLGLSTFGQEDKKSPRMREFYGGRIYELLNKGKKSLLIPENPRSIHVFDPNKSMGFSNVYKSGIQNGTDFRARRTEYMMARLEKGEHPDTNPEFWKDYKEVPRMSLEMKSALQKVFNGFLYNANAIFACLGGLAILVAWLLHKRKARA